MSTHYSSVYLFCWVRSTNAIPKCMYELYQYLYNRVDSSANYSERQFYSNSCFGIKRSKISLWLSFSTIANFQSFRLFDFAIAFLVVFISKKWVSSLYLTFPTPNFFSKESLNKELTCHSSIYRMVGKLSKTAT